MVEEIFVRHVLLQVAVCPAFKPGSGLPRHVSSRSAQKTTRYGTTNVLSYMKPVLFRSQNSSIIRSMLSWYEKLFRSAALYDGWVGVCV